MSTLAKFMIVAGKDNGWIIFNSVKNGPLVWPTVALENGIVRSKTYEELSNKEKLQADYDLKATNIVLQGLPLDVYALVNHHKAAKDIWDRVKLLMQGTYIWDRVKLLMQGTKLSKQERECKLYDEFDKFSYVKDLALAVPTFLPGDDPISCMNKVMAFFSAMFTPRYPSTNNQLRSSSNPRNQATAQDDRVTVQQAEGKELDEEQLAFLTDPGVADGQVAQTITHNVAFQTDDLDAYDFDCDDISSAKMVHMANLLSCDSDVLSE
ncbi:hypothetical protein Tco_1424309, partial [Tanacetum coccineum]